MSRVSASTANSDKRVAEWLFLLTFAVYGYFYAGAGWNQNSQFDLTRAIVERHTFALDDLARNTGDVARHAGHVYTNKSPGLSWMGAVPYAAMSRAGMSPVLLILYNYLCTLLTVVPFGALIPALLFLDRRGADAGWAAVVALAIAFGTQLFPYSTFFILHVPSGALMLLALTTKRPWLAGFAAALATAINYLCAPMILFVALLRGWRTLIGASPPLVALAVYQQVCFGSFVTIGIAREDPRFLTPGQAFGIFGTPSLDALIGITVSPYRGLFYFAPVLIVALGGAVIWLRQRDRLGELAAIAATSAIFFAFNVSFNGWEGGFGVGARYLVPLIPLWGLAMLRLRGWLRPLTVVLAAISFVFNFAAAAVDPQPSGTIPRPLTQYILPLLIHGRFSPDVPITAPWSAATFTGHASVNRLAHDEAVVFSRHPPGSPPSEWSSFNLGETFFGPGDARSLIPPLLLLAAGAAAIVRRSRSMPRSPAAIAPPSP